MVNETNEVKFDFTQADLDHIEAKLSQTMEELKAPPNARGVLCQFIAMGYGWSVYDKTQNEFVARRAEKHLLSLLKAPDFPLKIRILLWFGRVWRWVKNKFKGKRYG